MLRFFARIACIIVVVIMFLQLNGCTTYCLQRIDSNISIPNSSPSPTDERSAQETRIGFEFMANPRPEIKFNDENHSYSTGTDSTGKTVSLRYTGDNIHLKMPVVQGALMLDYTLTDHFFIFGKGNFSYWDDNFTGAFNIGAGLHFSFRKISFQAYLFPNIYKLRSNGNVLLIRTDAQTWLTTYDGITAYSSNNIYLGLGGGLQFATVAEKEKIHVMWGADLQSQKYLSFNYTANKGDSTEQLFNKNYSMFFLTPNMGLFRSFKNSQVNLMVRCGIPLYRTKSFGESDINLDIEQVFPTLSAAWVYCFNRSQE
jgi:hypothetical protein